MLPAFVLAYLVAAPTGFWRRIRQLLGAAAAVVVSAGWYVALVELWPAGSRPYIGGSQGNSILELALGYNGLGRIFGRGAGGGRAAAAPAGSRARAPAGSPVAAGARRFRRPGRADPAVQHRDRRPDRPGCCRPRWRCWSPGCG